MDWARDHIGNLVPAWRGGMSAYGLVCPSCGEPVMRRAGAERRPHFAHFSLRAKPECENYFPSEGLPGTSSRASSSAGAWRNHVVGSSVTCGVFLGYPAGGRSLELQLRIPPIDPNIIESGTLEIRTASGVRTYDAQSLRSSKLMMLRPKTPLGTCRGSADLLPLAARIGAELETFASGWNLFYANERGERHLRADEAAEWGAQYRLLAPEDVSPPGHLQQALDWRARPGLAGWKAYEFSLPTVFTASAEALRSQVSAFLGRHITAARPRVFLVDPYPHHIEADGTFVFPQAPSTILLRRTAAKQVAVHVEPIAGTCSVSNLSDEWVRVEAPLCGDALGVISIDGDEQIAFRVSPCALFRPGGLTARSGDSVWDTLCEPSIQTGELVERAVSITCDNERVAQYVARLNPPWTLADARTLVLAEGQSKEFDAGSFGEIRQTTPALRERRSDTIDDDRWSSTHQWIVGLVRASFGDAGLRRLEAYLGEPNAGNLHLLGALLGTWLVPYIRMAHQRKFGT